jgi:hypothetical protein
LGLHISISTPSDVVELSNPQTGALLGVSKVKGGNRMATAHLGRMTVVIYPMKRKARVWVIACMFSMSF